MKAKRTAQARSARLREDFSGGYLSVAPEGREYPTAWGDRERRDTPALRMLAVFVMAVDDFRRRIAGRQLCHSSSFATSCSSRLDTLGRDGSLP